MCGVAEKLYVYPCHWNFRPDHCMYGINCEPAIERGVSVLHGCRSTYHNDKQPAFKAVYEAFRDVSVTISFQGSGLTGLLHSLFMGGSYSNKLAEQQPVGRRVELKQEPVSPSSEYSIAFISSRCALQRLRRSIRFLSIFGFLMIFCRKTHKGQTQKAVQR